jgi:hypothetical protein
MNRILSTACVAIAASASLLLMNASIASADPDVVGMKYGAAKGEIYKANLTPVVATVIGDRVSQNDCFVVSTSRVTSRDSSGRPSNQPVVQVNLSCYARPADRVSPGFSAGNFAPEAEAVRAEKAAADLKWRKSDEGQKWCTEQLTAHPDWTIEGCVPVVAPTS